MKQSVTRKQSELIALHILATTPTNTRHQNASSGLIFLLIVAVAILLATMSLAGLTASLARLGAM